MAGLAEDEARFLDDQAYKEALFFGPKAKGIRLKHRNELKGLQQEALSGGYQRYAPYKTIPGGPRDTGVQHASGGIVQLPSGHAAFEVSDAHRKPVYRPVALAHCQMFFLAPLARMSSRHTPSWLGSP